MSSATTRACRASGEAPGDSAGSMIASVRLPAFVVAEQRGEVDVEAQVVAGVFEVAARAGGVVVLGGGVEAVEGEALGLRPLLVVVAHPGDERAVVVLVAPAVGEAVAHDRVEVLVAALDVVVDEEGGAAAGLQGDRAEALLRQPGEEVVAEPPEGGLGVGVGSPRPSSSHDGGTTSRMS